MEDPKTPGDRWNIIYITLVFHGLGTLTAWNMFITAKDYFVEYKLVDTPVYADNFLAYMGIASQIPNFVFNWFNVFVKYAGNLRRRILLSLFIEVVLFILTITLAMMDSTQWPGTFFWITMITVFLLNGFNAIYQNSVFGAAACLPPRFMGALILGANICGTMVVLLAWVTRSLKSLRTAAIYYFLGGMFILILCFDTYFALPINKFYRHHDSKQRKEAGLIRPPIGKRETPYLKIFRQAAVQLYNIFFTFFVTLAVFPAVCSDVLPVTAGFLGDNFVIVTCFLTFNVMAMVGNITATFFPYPRPQYLIIMTTVRVLFIPFFLFCNYQPPRRVAAVLINSDYAYWVGVALLGWSSGHASSLGMIYVSNNVDPEHAMSTGMIGAAMLITGITFGVFFTRLCPIMVQ